MSKLRLFLLPLVVTCGLLVSACSGSVTGVDLAETESPGEQFIYPAPLFRDGSKPADGVLDWMDLQNSLLRREGLSPPVATRILAYTAIALESAAALADPAARPFDFAGLQLPESSGAELNQQIAGATAAAAVIRGLIPGVEAQQSVNVLESLQIDRADASADVRAESEDLGTQVAEAVLTFAAGDGYDTLAQRVEPDSPTPGGWVPTPPKYLYPLEPEWGQLRPLVVASSQCPVADPVAYDETPGSLFHQQAMAVVEAVDAVTDDQRASVLHWRDQAAWSFTPAGHWMAIARSAMESDAEGGDLTYLEAARVNAVLASAQADTFIATWEVKFRTNVVRPITYLRTVFDPSWTPLIANPPFPEYPSGHSAGSAASATVLAALLGDRGFTDSSYVDVQQEARTYESFMAAADESSQSRLIAGIHFPMGIEAGQQQGICVAESVLTQLVGVGG